MDLHSDNKWVEQDPVNNEYLSKPSGTKHPVRTLPSRSTDVRHWLYHTIVLILI